MQSEKNTRHASGRRLLRWVLGLLIGLLCVWLSMRNLDFSELQATLQSANRAWVFASLGSVVGVAILKSIRWWFLYPRANRPQSWHRAFAVLLTGQMVNVLIPLRLGEIVRIGLMLQERISPGITLSTIVVEKSLELLAVGLLLVITLPVAVLPDWFPTSGGMGMGAIGAVLLLGLLIIWKLRHWLLSVAKKVLSFRNWIPVIWRKRLLKLMTEVLNGLEALTDYRSALPVFGLTALVWLFSVLTMLFMFNAFHLDLLWVVGVVLSLALTLSNLVPQPPAMIGVVGAVTVMTLGWFGVAQRDAAALGLLLNVVMVSPLVLIGGWATWSRFWSLRHLPWRDRWASSIGLKKSEGLGKTRGLGKSKPPEVKR